MDRFRRSSQQDPHQQIADGLELDSSQNLLFRPTRSLFLEGAQAAASSDAAYPRRGMRWRAALLHELWQGDWDRSRAAAAAACKNNLLRGLSNQRNKASFCR